VVQTGSNGRGSEVGDQVIRDLIRAAVRFLGLLVATSILVACASPGGIGPSPTDPEPASPEGATVAPSPSPTPSPGRPGFVQRQGRDLVVDGEPFRFTGFNIYNATSLSEHGCWYPMGTLESVGRSLDAIGDGQEVLRSWFFQFQATRDGRRDWSSFDAVLAVARDRGYRVIPVLVNQWGDCEGWPERDAGYKDEAWYASGFRTTPTSPGMPATYEEWVREVVTRYRDDPTIMAWQLVNEAEAGSAFEGECSETAAATLKAFASHMGRLIKEIDPDHLVSLGTIGSGQCGARGTEYFDLHDVPEIDLCEYHDYNDVSALPGDRWNGLRRRIAQCAHLDKPLFVGEVGLHASQADGTLEGRARALDRKVRVQFSAGVVGVLAWLWRDGEHGGSSLDGYEIGPGDPVLEVLSGA
jgi:mannan endo-1,4-beta-mannosidase